MNEYKCDVNHVDKDGQNGFMWACRGGYKEVVELLVNEYKCDIRFMNKLKKSAFDYAKTREIKSLILQVLLFVTFYNNYLILLQPLALAPRRQFPG